MWLSKRTVSYPMQARISGLQAAPSLLKGRKSTMYVTMGFSGGLGEMIEMR